MGILKHLLGGGHGSRHGYGSHGNRHGQNGSYGDPNLNPQPRQAALACGACGAAQAAGGRFCAQCGASLTPAARAMPGDACARREFLRTVRRRIF